MPSILIIDDDQLLCNMVARHISGMGHEVVSAQSLAKGLEAVSSRGFDVIFLDVCLPDGSGLEALPTIMAAPDAPEIIIITGAGDPDGAELAIKSGAWAYVEKPLSMKNLSLQLTRALRYRQAKTKPRMLLKRGELIGSSPAFEACLARAAQVADSDISVLITGETGTGKELFAKTIHQNSRRSGKNFVVVDCASLPETLVGSMLFGHERGAFTGAEKPRVGFIKDADGGTLFLDEVGELPLTVQKDFLRALQEHRFRPLGADREVESDFRLVSATNRDLEAMVKSGRFRKDLFFRLQSVAIEIPPLRARPGDIRELTLHYMAKLCERYGTEIKGFSPDFFEAMAAYDWPGNVRELINTVESVLAVARFEPTLFPRHLPVEIRVHKARASVGGKKATEGAFAGDDLRASTLPKLQDARDAALAKAENRYLHDLVLFTRGNIKEACRISGLSQSRLYHLLKKHKINRS